MWGKTFPVIENFVRRFQSEEAYRAFATLDSVAVGIPKYVPERRCTFNNTIQDIGGKFLGIAYHKRTVATREPSFYHVKWQMARRDLHRTLLRFYAYLATEVDVFGNRIPQFQKNAQNAQNSENGETYLKNTLRSFHFKEILQILSLFCQKILYLCKNQVQWGATDVV